MRWEALLTLSKPLMPLYGLEIESPEDVSSGRIRQQDCREIFSVSRLLWSYFEIQEEERPKHLPTLAGRVLGTNPDPDEITLFDAILDKMETSWKVLRGDASNIIELPPENAPSFDDLVTQFSNRKPDPTPVFTPSRRESYGPEALEPAEAMALFSSPLLEDVEVLIDPEKYDAAIHRANDYWDLGHMPTDEHFEGRLEDVISTYSGNGVDIRKEAWEMISRFRTLFPEI